MNAAESLFRTARAAGVELCLANPGTTEMPLVAALDAVPGMRGVLCLFEGVCTGAADGYGRMTGRPALTLLHLGPGFANGIANLHNARRAHSPVVNLIGDQASWHLEHDAPLTSDILSLARPVSAWVRTSERADGVATDFAEAIAAATGPPGRVATLVLPADLQAGAAPGPASVPAQAAPADPDATRVEHAADALREAAKANASTTLLLGGDALHEAGLRAAARIAEATGTRLVAETFPARWERGRGLPAPMRLPYFPEQVIDLLKPDRAVVLAGAREPVAFFGYEGVPSLLVPEEKQRCLATPEENATAALEALAAALEAGGSSTAPIATGDSMPASSESGPLTGALNPGSIGAVLAQLLPEDAIVVDEAATSGLPFYLHSAGAARHSLLSLTGGAIGQGLPCATGAALACPDRRVIAFQADGSGMYTLQALWTQAREGLDVTTLLCSNRAYRILQVELARAGIAEPGRQALSLTGLDRPELDWVALAKGCGVPGVRVESAEALSSALARSLSEPGPMLIEMMI
jgi:acetolactate synthase-1/2/3 large subunit